MNYKMMFVLNAIVAFVLGVAFFIAPVTALEFFGTETYVATVLMARFFGAGMVALGLLLWFTKDVEDNSIQKNMGISLLISSILGLIVNVIGVSGASGVIRNYGWLTIIIYILFALGYAFLLFMKPRMKEE